LAIASVASLRRAASPIQVARPLPGERTPGSGPSETHREMLAVVANCGACCSTSYRIRKLGLIAPYLLLRELAELRFQEFLIRLPCPLNNTLEDSFQKVPMTVRLVLRAMAHESYVPTPRKNAQQTQGELLAVVLDSLVLRVCLKLPEQFGTITAAKVSPRQPARTVGMQQALTRAQIRHPYIVFRSFQATPLRARGQYAKTILRPVDRRVDRFRPEHQGPQRITASLNGESRE
jgi:hypothetical protein